MIELPASASLTIILALLAAFVALHQVKSNVISTSRIRWIEEFKKTISEYDNSVLQMIFNYGMYRKYLMKTDDKKIKHEKYYDEYVKFHYLIYTHEANISLNLNLEEKMYRDINFAILAVRNEINRIDKENDIDTDQLYRGTTLLLRDLRKVSQLALKKEWKKSKNMFYINWFRI